MIAQGKPGRRGGVLLAAASAGVSLLLAEGAARLLTDLPVTTTSNQVAHSALLYVTSPSVPGVNRHGFRTGDAMTGEVAAIGDSHTYGFNVTGSKSWPAVLQDSVGLTVLNLGVGSYGVYQYAYLVDYAVEREVQDIIVGLYPANDLQPERWCDLYALTYWRERAARQRLGTRACSQLPSAQRGTRDAQQRGYLGTWIAHHTALGNLLLIVRNRIGSIVTPHGSVGALPEPDRDSVRIVAHTKGTNLDDETIREAFTNAVLLFRRMSAAARTRSAALGILFIPSKERVIAESARVHGLAVPEELARAALQEERLVGRFKAAFAELHLPSEDAIGDLAEHYDHNAGLGGGLYPPDDGHPTERGYQLYAAAAARLLGVLHGTKTDRTAQR